MEINGKTYKYIFWDWLWTVYDGTNDKLFDWVVPEFEKMSSVQHFLVTWTSDVDKRSAQIEASPIRKYFTEVSISIENKAGIFKQLIERHQIPTEELIIIGDSFTNEIQAAKDLGLNWMHISDFVNLIK